MSLTKLDDGIYVDNNLDDLQSTDSIIFDCDGVLVDITKSYDLCIQKTCQYILSKYAGIENSILIDSQIIDGFKATGGFNDEVDLTYAAILAIAAAEKLSKDQTEFIFQVIANSNSSGISSTENYLEKISDISKIKTTLSYPGPHHKNLLYSVFDQLFYGPELYHKLFNKKSEFSESGLIENDKVIVSKMLLDKLKQKYNSKIGIVTGRGIESIRYSLKQLLEQFDLNNSAFLEDESRELAKPNPISLINSIKGMSSEHSLYVGDSMEDFIMAKKATESGTKTTFCGIIGTSKNPEKKLELFDSSGASIVLDSIDLLPKVLNLE